MLSRAYDCPTCLDLTKLCVVPGQQCWVLYIDVLVGNLSDLKIILPSKSEDLIQMCV